MATINLKNPWTFRTPLRTIDFAAGQHEVDDEVSSAAETEGASKEASDGDGDSKTRKTRTADTLEG